MPSRLTPHDSNVLEKIRDPEFAAAPVLINDSLPRDPNLTDKDVYDAAAAAQTKILKDVLALEKLQVEHDEKYPKPERATIESDADRTFRSSMLAKWLVVIMRLDQLVEKFPNFASARNNRVMALRNLYGDGAFVKLWVDEMMTDEKGQMIRLHDLVKDGLPARHTVVAGPEEHDRTLKEVADKVLADLTQGIALLTPKTPFGAVSPKQAENLSTLYLQRGRLYRVAATKLALDGKATESVVSARGMTFRDVHLKAEFRGSGTPKDAQWSSFDFEENASKDFMMAGHYGSVIGKGLAVATSPTAKLCGEMVREAMKKEFSGRVPE